MTAARRVGFAVSRALEVQPVVLEGDDKEARTWSSFVHADVADVSGEYVPMCLMEQAVRRFIERGGEVIDGHTNKIRGRMLSVELMQHPTLDVPALRGTFVANKGYHGDDRFWERMRAGAYTGMSWGGDAVKIVDQCLDQSCSATIGLYVEPPEIYEYSVVESPANPGATMVEVNQKAKGHAHLPRLWDEYARAKAAKPCCSPCAAKAKAEAEARTKPVGPYATVRECEGDNADKDDPGAFCAWLEQRAKEGAEHDDAAPEKTEPEAPEGEGLSGAVVASTPALEESEMALTPEEQARMKALEDENVRLMADLEARTKADADARWQALEARVKAAEDLAAAAKAKADAWPPKDEEDKEKMADDAKPSEEEEKAKAASEERIKALEAELQKLKDAGAAKAKGSTSTTPRPVAAGTAPGGAGATTPPSPDQGAARMKARAVPTAEVAKARSFAELRTMAFPTEDAAQN